MLYGYVRVSTKDQKVDVQVNELAAAGVEQVNIFADIAVSGKRASRPELDALLPRRRGGRHQT